MATVGPMTWSPADLPDLTGTTAVVTGGNSGIGFHAARELVRSGATVTLACRDLDAAGVAADRIAGEAGHRGGAVHVRHLDLASQKSVHAFADAWDGPLDLLVNNAGVMAPPRYRATEDAHELQFGVNHLGHFALTGRLLPALLAAPAPRVTTVSSIAHHAGGTDVVEGNPASSYSPQHCYGNSKLANLLFALELQRRATGTHLTSTACHPGVSATGLVADTEGLGALPLVKYVAPLFVRIAFQSAAAGANPTLYAATTAEPGSYTGPQWLREQRGPVGPAKLSREARDADLAARLWTVSEELTGVAFAWS